jgi:glycogen operon protein
LRARQQRNFIATLMLSQGIPMLVGGDEIGRTQNGNNNAYCQDNEISWFDWPHADLDLLDFTRRVIGLRNGHPVLRRRKWFKGRQIRGQHASDIAWLRPDGGEMSDDDWNGSFAKSLAVFYNGDGLLDVDERAMPVTDDSFLLVFNAHADSVAFTIPGAPFTPDGARWNLALTTAEQLDAAPLAGGDTIEAPPRSVTVLSRPSPGARATRRTSAPTRRKSKPAKEHRS